MAVLASMGCAILALLAAILGTSNKRRRFVVAGGGRKSPPSIVIDDCDVDNRMCRDDNVEANPGAPQE